MRVLFLDIDGVLNSTAFMVTQAAAGLWDYGPRDDWSNHIDPAAVTLLNDVVAKTDAKIVVSSSWRLARPVADIWRDLKRHSFSGELIDSTPYCSGEPRAFEIAAWLKHRGNPGTSFAIVDDDLDAGLGMEDRFVRTSHPIGLTRADADELIAILIRDESL